MSVQSFIKIEKSSDEWTCPGHALTHNKVLIFSQTPVNIKVSMSSAPKLALVSASRYKSGYSINTLMPVQSFIMIERGSEGGPWLQT